MWFLGTHRKVSKLIMKCLILLYSASVILGQMTPYYSGKHVIKMGKVLYQFEHCKSQKVGRKKVSRFGTKVQ